MQLRDLAEAIDADLVGDGGLEVERAVHPADAERPGDLALAMESGLVALLADSKAAAAVVTDADAAQGPQRGYLVVGRGRYAMAKLMDVFARPPRAHPGVHPSAVVEADAVLGEEVSVGAFVYVGAGARVGARSVLLDHVTVGADAELGEDCLIHPGARIGERVVLGNRVIVHHNASIGADGFSFVTPQPGSVETAKATGRIEATNTDIVRINSVGTVILEDDVEIGACTAIDRGTVSATRVGRNTKIDNLVMVGHNCIIGENCFICGQVGIAGSSEIGDRVVLAGQAGVADHVTIGSDTIIAASSGVGRNVPPKSLLVGTPAVDKAKAFEQWIYIGRLKSMHNDLATLKKRVKALEPGDGDVE